MNEGLERLKEAFTHLQTGAWEAAHKIVQEDESDLASWMHALVHLQEGDVSNAHYWFRRAGQPVKAVSDIGTELKRIQAQLAQAEE